MNIIKFFICLLCFSMIPETHAQILKGRVTDESGKPVIAASVFIKEMKYGTSANEEGYYDIRLAEGVYTCIFQCLGYETQNHKVTITSESVILDIHLKEKAYEIKEVIISDKREDPAYGIMRRAIAMAPYYMNQVEEYKADLYLKGSLQIIKISGLVKRLAKEELKDYKEGNTYVEESFNEIDFKAPNKYEQKVVKQTGSLPKQDDGGNAMGMITISVYDPKAILPSISPLSTEAFAHYKFQYEGFVEEDDRIINKIKIIPRHKSKQLVSGHIYIADNYWNVHSLDVTGQFVIGGDYRIRVNFGEVSDNIWLPISHRIDFNGSILGNKGSFHYNSSLKYANIIENTSIRKPDVLLLAEQQRKAMQQNEAPPLELQDKPKPTGKNAQKIEKILSKDKISNREAYQLSKLMQKEADAKKKENESLNITDSYSNNYDIKIDSAANKPDSTYWARMRPVPLSADELKSYKDKASLQNGPVRQQTDSSTVQKSRSGSSFGQTIKDIFWGTDFKLGKSGGNLEYRGLRPSNLGFNTVDGFFIGQKLVYTKNFSSEEKRKRLSITPEVTWAINRKTVMWDVNTSLSYLPLHRGNLSLSFGRKSFDFNSRQGMFPLENTIATLFFRRNYMKLYEQDYIHINNTIDIANGLQLFTELQYAERTMLDNYSDYSFFYQDSREYDPNIPQNAELAYPLNNHTNASFQLSLNYTPKFFYRIDRNNRKRMVKSDFPTFFLGWRKGVKDIFGSDTDYDLIYGGLNQRIETGLLQQFRYSVNVGGFVNRKSVYFPDFRHFNTLEIPATIGSINNSNFHLLEYYRYSTVDKYIEAHLYYFTPFLALKYLPFFNNRLWQEGLQLNYLYTPEMKNYMEVGYMIGLVWQVGVFVGFENFSYRSVGVKISLPLILLKN